MAISIHPPRVGWDMYDSLKTVSQAKISIHPPRVGWDNQRKEPCKAR